MKTKYYKIACALAALVGFSSCSDFLEVEPRDKIVLDKFWNERADVESVVASCYSSLQSSACIKRMMIWGEARSETMDAGDDMDKDVNLENIFKANITSTNPYTSWVDFYYVINTCNTVIKYAPDVAAKDPGYTESELKATVAEVSALRDLCYFYLIRTFRDVPYTTEPYLDDNQTMDLPATPFEEILDTLIADLESVKGDAVHYYPTTKTNYQTGRITSTAINAMLCEMYLWKQDYQKCIDYADEVIDDMKEQSEKERQESGFNATTVDQEMEGYPLLAARYSNSQNTFGSNYSQIFGTGNSSESIFELTFDKQNESMLANDAVADFYGYSTKMMGYMSAASYVGSDVSQKQYNVFVNKLDARNYYNICGMGTTYSIGKYAYKYCDIQVEGNNASSATVTTLYSGMYPSGQVRANWIIYRLADIMLMKAEALTQLMSDNADTGISDADKAYRDRAFRLVTVINKRSLCQYPRKDTLDATSYATKAAIENLVYDERRRELMFEGKRWYDLVRRARREGKTDYLKSQSCNKYSSNKQLVESKLNRMEAIYWPYNYDELKVNKNLKQNPAFGSGLNESYE